MAKEVLILSARDAGATITEIAPIVNLDASTVSRRCDAARLRLAHDAKLKFANERVEQKYLEKLGELHV